MPSPLVIVEDNPDDVVFIERVITRARIANTTIVCADAEQGRGVIRSLGEQSILPALVLIDIRLPGESGLDFLAWLRTQGGAIAAIPSIILTISASMFEEHRAERLGAALYLHKPVDADLLLEAVQGLGIGIIESPEGRRILTGTA